jgi:amino-acid N-acetyltransferase
MKTRKARAADIPAIHGLIEHYAAAGILLPRDPDDLRRHLSGFLVVVEKAEIIGCVSLERYNPNLAEIRSLAVQPDARGRGLGTRLLKAALDLAEGLRIGKVFALTSSPQFFTGQGFRVANRHAMHEKVDRDCIHCSKSRTCKLSAVVIDVSAEYSALNIIDVDADTVRAE